MHAFPVLHLPGSKHRNSVSFYLASILSTLNQRTQYLYFSMVWEFLKISNIMLEQSYK